MFGWISRAIGWAVNSLPTDIVHWVGDLINGVYGFFHTVSGLVGAAWAILFTNLKDNVDSAIGFIKEVTHFATWLIDVWWPGLWKWFMQHVVSPLDTALKWLAHEGATIWHYISHPADLVDLIWDDLIAKLETEAWVTGEKLGKFFLALLIKNLATFLKILEDVIDAVF